MGEKSRGRLEDLVSFPQLCILPPQPGSISSTGSPVGGVIPSPFARRIQFRSVPDAHPAARRSRGAPSSGNTIPEPYAPRKQAYRSILKLAIILSWCRHETILPCQQHLHQTPTTRTTLACDLWGVKPDLMTLGKALGGGIVPVSAVVGRRDVLGVLGPGQHGSTFGGNPLSAAVAREVVQILAEGKPQANVRRLAPQMRRGLESMEGIEHFTHVGLWSGVTIPEELGTGRDLCERLAAHGVLAKDTHGSTVRLSPPLTVTSEDVEFMLTGLAAALADLG